MQFLTLDKNFVLDNFSFVQDKKYFVRAEGRGIRQFQFCPGQKTFCPSRRTRHEILKNLFGIHTLFARWPIQEQLKYTKIIGYFWGKNSQNFLRQMPRPSARTKYFLSWTKLKLSKIEILSRVKKYIFFFQKSFKTKFPD